MDQQYLSVAELARAAGVNEKSIRRAIEGGRLPADKDERTGRYRITPEAGFKLYPPIATEAPEAEPDTEGPELDSGGEREPVEAPRGWHEGYAHGQLDCARAILALDCTSELWGALRAMLLTGSGEW